MNNCLVTKLKGVVNNDELDRFGYVKLIVINPNQNGKHVIRLRGLSGYYVELEGGTFTYTGSNRTELTSSNTYVSIDTVTPDPTGDGYVYAYIPKYGCTDINVYREPIESPWEDLVDIKKFTYTTNCVYFNLSRTWTGTAEDILNMKFSDNLYDFSLVYPYNLTGKLNGFGRIFSKYKNLTSINFGGHSTQCWLTGDISDIGLIQNLTNFYPFDFNSDLTFTVETFVQYAKSQEGGSRTKGHLSMPWAGSMGVHFNGAVNRTHNVDTAIDWKPTETSIPGAVTDVQYNGVAIAIDANGKKVGDATPW
jgi:hypothetical protein